MFRLFSFLSDKTGGARFFVKYKLLLGTLIVGFIASASSCKPKKNDVSCYVIATEPDSIYTTCYDTIPPGKITPNDSFVLKGHLVNENKEPLAGVSVYIKDDNSDAVHSDLEGYFKITVQPDNVLRFTYISQPVDIPVSKLKKDETNEIILPF